MSNMFISRTTRNVTTGLAIAALAFSLAGCSSAPASKAEGTSPSASAEQASKSPVSITDAWAKATKEDAKPGEAMTGVFGTLKNSSDKDLTITGVKSDAADDVELHEVVDGVMLEIKGDVVIPAGGTYELVPGGNHIMLMQIKHPLLPGDDVNVTVSFSDGSSLDVKALVKDTLGANETYESGSDEHAGH